MTNDMRDDLNWRYHIVAYLDVMGQKDAFKNVDSIPSNEEEKKRLIEALKKTYTFIKYLRSGFQDFFNQSKIPTGIERNIPEDKKPLYEQMTGIDIHFSHFSDFVVAWAPLETDSHSCVQMNSVWGIMSACASMVLLSLFTKHAIRGGINVGTGLEMDSGELYGPALNKAYGLESQVADYPRIVIGGQLINYLQVHKDMPGQDVFSRYARARAAACIKMIKRDIDGFPFLDWLGEDIEQLFNDVQSRRKDTTATTEQILQGVARFISEEREQFVLKQDPKLVGRYTKLGNYFHSRVAHWKAWSKNDKK